MPLHDFQCECGYEGEELLVAGEPAICPTCDNLMKRVWTKSPSVLTHIIPSYPGCKRQKAGYMHTSKSDQNATRVQSGYGGCTAPKD